jgi:uncharacterized protein (DUF1684 family)
MSSLNLDLLDFRRQVFGAYSELRRSGDPQAGALRFRFLRDRLFQTHPQSALDERQKQDFHGLSSFPYDPGFRVLAEVAPLSEPLTIVLALNEDGTARLERIGRVEVRLPTGRGTLDVFWIGGYGGGVFLPFADRTNGGLTYSGGRYLLDTIKGADLGSDGSKLVLDFNLAYNPSCAYNPRWVCPLAPPGNRLDFAVPVGEKKFEETFPDL